MRLALPLALVLASACSRGQHLAQVSHPTLDLQLVGNSSGELTLQALVNANDCPSLPHLSGELDGQPLHLTDPGGLEQDLLDDSKCLPALLEAPLPAPRPGSSRITISDGSTSLEMLVVDFLLERTVTVTPAIARPGDEVTLTWDDANDVFPAAVYDSFGNPQGLDDDCGSFSSQEVQLGYGNCVPSHLSGRTVTFTVPQGLSPQLVKITWASLYRVAPFISTCTASSCSAPVAYSADIELGIAP